MEDISFRPAVASDSDLVFRIKKAALRPYVEKIWGWDEQTQRELHDGRFEPTNLQILTSGDRDVGMLHVEQSHDLIEIHGIFLFPEFQGHGIGTKLIQDILAEASSKALPVRLQCFKVNPVRSLYERLGFVVVGETDTHYQWEKSG